MFKSSPYTIKKCTQTLSFKKKDTSIAFKYTNFKFRLCVGHFALADFSSYCVLSTNLDGVVKL